MGRDLIDGSITVIGNRPRRAGYLEVGTIKGQAMAPLISEVMLLLCRGGQSKEFLKHNQVRECTSGWTGLR